MPQGSMANAVQEVVQNGFCSGCGLCASIAPEGAIRMTISHAGYLRPQVLKPDQLGSAAVFDDVCPGRVIKHTGARARYDPIWGPLLSVCAGHSTDPEMRRQGSSGGVVSAIAAYLLSQRKVDYVAQIAVSGDDPLRNEMQVSRTRSDVIRAAGSRYSPSAPLAGLRDLLDRGETFAIIGKPCDIAALRRYARHDSRVNRLIPYMLSFMCAGIPSMAGTHAILSEFGICSEDVESFRYRGDGWPGKTRAITKSGDSREMDYNQSWGEILGKHIQFRCKICPDGTGEFADVVCADAWYGTDGYPDFSEREGRSLVIARSEIGGAILKDMKVLDLLVLSRLSPREIRHMQPFQADRKKLVLGRILATKIARGRSPNYSNLRLVRASIRSSPIVWMRNFFGTLRRAGKSSE